MTVRFEHCSGGRKKDKNGWNIKKRVGPVPSLGENAVTQRSQELGLR